MWQFGASLSHWYNCNCSYRIDWCCRSSIVGCSLPLEVHFLSSALGSTTKLRVLFSFTLDMLCSLATGNHSISFSNCSDSISCTWLQMVGQGKIYSIVEAFEPHGSAGFDSKTRSNIEQLLCKLTRVLEMAGSKVRLKAYESVCFRSIASVLLALQISRSWIWIVL